jgi:CubicO group peptidase (beta-lactamase class C family)
MVRFLKIFAAAVGAVAIWTGLVVAGEFEGWWRASAAAPGDTRAFLAAATQKIDSASGGNAVFVLIENGKPVGEHFVSRGKPVDGDTLFQVASLSKWITAWGVMALVERGKIDLDAPVSRYLTRWSLPKGKFSNDGVTVRRLLSHTAGLTDGLGYAGFKPGQPIQTLEASLTRAADASPGSSGVTRVGSEPGIGWAYSGGGYTLMQLLIEEVSGQPFNTYMTETVFRPLGMTRSTFLIDDTTANVAEIYDVDGSKATHFRFTGVAAASLYTSGADMTRFIQAHLKGPNGEAAGRGVLRPETLVAMRQPHASQWGADIWGLGMILYAPNNAGSFVVGHDGGNAPAINTTARFDPATGDGIVVLETGNKRLASELAGEWIFWKTGNVDFVTLTMEAKDTFIFTAGAGALVFLIIGFAGWRMTRPRRDQRA